MVELDTSWLNWTRSEKFESHDPYESEDQDRHRDAVLKEIDSEVSLFKVA
jgi:hypothetical protein